MNTLQKVGNAQSLILNIQREFNENNLFNDYINEELNKALKALQTVGIELEQAELSKVD